MKKHLTLILTILIFMVKAQTLDTEYFSFNCDCSQDENYYNSKNQSYNYSYGEKDGSSGYLFAIRKMLHRDKQQQKSYLLSIKDSKKFNYYESKFAGEYALVADISQPNAHGKQVVLFHNDIVYTMMVVGSTKVMVEKLYNNLLVTFQFK